MRRSLMTVWLVLGMTIGLRAQQPPGGAPPPAPGGPGQGRGAGGRGAPVLDPAAIGRGQQIYAQNCITCHGPTGRGGAEAAADLSTSAIALANDGGRQLAEFLKVGRPERRMPAVALADADVADLSVFLRSLFPPGRGAGGRGQITAVVVGDAKAGEAYFNGAGGCTKCHSATGDLKGIGSRLPVAAIQGRIVLPRGSGGYPPSFNSPPDPNEAPKTVTITPATGAPISGTLLWVTDFYVTLRDSQGVQRTVARNGDHAEGRDHGSAAGAPRPHAHA